MRYKTLGELRDHTENLSNKGKISSGNKTKKRGDPRFRSKKFKIENQKKKEFVKYIYFSEFASRKSGFYKMGSQTLRNRTYYITVLTETNRMSIIQFHMKSVELSSKRMYQLKRLLLDKFKFRFETDVVFDKRITKYDMLFQLMKIVQSICQFTIARVETDHMFKNVIRYFTLGLGLDGDFGIKRKTEVFEKSREYGLLDFIPDDIVESIMVSDDNKKEMLLDSAISILYMWKRSEKRNYDELHYGDCPK